MKIVICEKCFNIPKITILNNNKVKIECENCKESRIEDNDYFNKFINNDGHTHLFDLDYCNYDNHEEKAVSLLYCFQCKKYICESCLNNIHNKSSIQQKHSTTNQKIINEYFCKEHGQNEYEYILDHYCIKCKKYLCSKFK